MPARPLPWTAGPGRRMALTIAAAMLLCILLAQPGAGKFQPRRGQNTNVLEGYPVSMTSGHRGHGEADVVLRVYLPFHRSSSQSPELHICTDLSDREAVPMAEAVAFAFELLREARDPQRHHNFSLGYDLYDTCASLPPFLTHIEPLIGANDPSIKRRYIATSQNCTACFARLPEPTAMHTILDDCRADAQMHDYADADLSTGDGVGSGFPDIFGGTTECGRDVDNHFFGPYPRVYIGPVTNRLFASVSTLLREDNTPQLHVSPTPVFEDSELEGELSFRTAASYEVQVDALMEVCLAQDWRYLAVIISEHHHHEQVKSILESAANLKGICLATELRLAHTHGHVNASILEFFAGLRRQASLTTVIVLADEIDTLNIWNVLGDAAANSDLMGSASRGVLDWQWIGLQDWEFVAKKAVHLQTTVDGAPPLALRVVPELWAPLPSNYTWASIRQRFKARLEELKPTPEVLLRSPWLAPVWEKVNRCHLTCNLSYTAAKRNASCCEQGQYNKDHPHVHFGTRKDYKWKNCTDLSASSVAAEFLLDQSLQIMNVVFLVENATRYLVDLGLKRCKAEQRHLFYKYECNALIEFEKSKDPALFQRATDYLETTLLHSEEYQRLLNDSFQTHLAEVSANTSRNNSNSTQSQVVLGVLSIEQLVRSGGGWRMNSAGRVLQHADNQTVQLHVNITSLSQYKLSTCPLPPCPDGYRALQLHHVRTCCFLCESCPPGSIRNVSTDETCQYCPVRSQSNLNHTQCVEYPLEYPEISAADDGPMAVLCLSLLGAFAIALTFIIFRINRNNMIVKSADTALSTALLATLLASFLCVNVLILKPTDTTCILQMALALIWPVVYVSGLAIKTNRLRVVFQQSSKLSRRNMRYLSNKAQLLVLVLVGVITSSYFVAWGLLSPPTAAIISGSTTRKLICKFSSRWMGGYFAYTITLIAVTSALAYFTRHLPGFFNEAAYHFLASALILACWIILVPAYYFSKQVPPSIILAAIVLAQGYSIFGSLFLRRLYYIWSPPEESSSQFLTSSVGSSYSQRTVAGTRGAADAGSNGNGQASIGNAESCARVSLGPDAAADAKEPLKANGIGGDYTDEERPVAVVLQSCPKPAAHTPGLVQALRGSTLPPFQHPTETAGDSNRASREPGIPAAAVSGDKPEMDSAAATTTAAAAPLRDAGTPNSAIGKQLSAAACSSEVSAAFVFLASSASSSGGDGVPSSSSPAAAEHLAGTAGDGGGGGGDGDDDTSPFALKQ